MLKRRSACFVSRVSDGRPISGRPVKLSKSTWTKIAIVYRCWPKIGIVYRFRAEISPIFDFMRSHAKHLHNRLRERPGHKTKCVRKFHKLIFESIHNPDFCPRPIHKADFCPRPINISIIEIVCESPSFAFERTESTESTESTGCVESVEGPKSHAPRRASVLLRWDWSQRPSTACAQACFGSMASLYLIATAISSVFRSWIFRLKSSDETHILNLRPR